MRIRSLLPAFLAVLLPTATAQQNALPAEMIAAFVPNRVWAQQVWLPVNSSAGKILGRITYTNADASGEVEISWIFQAQGGAPSTLIQTIGTSFQPTAVARRAGTTDTLHVVGWSARTGRVLVETWTFEVPLLAAATATTGPGGPVVSGMPVPAVTRVLEWVSEPLQLPPVWDAAWQMYSERLLLLTRGSPPEVPTALWSLDLASGGLEIVVDAGTWPELEGRRRIGLGMHPTGGLVALLSRRRPWDHGRFEPRPVTYFVLRDSNGDGAFDFIGPLSVEDMASLFPSPWDGKYSEP